MKSSRYLMMLVVVVCLTAPARGAAGEECQGCRRSAALLEADAVGFSSEQWRSILSRLVEALTTPCFHLQDLDVYAAYREKAEREGWSSLEKASKWKPPEYTLKARYETGLEGTVKSRMIIRLFFTDGELVTEWITESDRPTFTYGGHINRMFANPSAEMKKDRSIHQRLWEFEGQPRRCIVSPNSPKVAVASVIDLSLSGFTDATSRPAKRFNRVIVHALEGTIENGVPLTSDPTFRAFALADGNPILVKYRAPGLTGKHQDTVQVFNSCEILPVGVIPLEMTSMGDAIAEATIELEKGQVLYLKYQQEGATASTGGDTVEYWIERDNVRMDQVIDVGRVSGIVDIGRKRIYTVRREKGEYVVYSLDFAGDIVKKMDEKSEGAVKPLLGLLNWKFAGSVQDTGEEREVHGYHCRRYIETFTFGPVTLHIDDWVTNQIDMGNMTYGDYKRNQLYCMGMAATDPLGFAELELELSKVKGLTVFSRTEVTTTFGKQDAAPQVSTLRLLETRLVERSEGLFEVPAGYVRVEW